MINHSINLIFLLDCPWPGGSRNTQLTHSQTFMDHKNITSGSVANISSILVILANNSSILVGKQFLFYVQSSWHSPTKKKKKRKRNILLEQLRIIVFYLFWRVAKEAQMACKKKSYCWLVMVSIYHNSPIYRSQMVIYHNFAD